MIDKIDIVVAEMAANTFGGWLDEAMAYGSRFRVIESQK